MRRREIHLVLLHELTELIGNNAFHSRCLGFAENPLFYEEPIKTAADMFFFLAVRPLVS